MRSVSLLRPVQQTEGWAAAGFFLPRPIRAGTLAIGVRDLTIDALPSDHPHCEGRGGRSTRAKLRAGVDAAVTVQSTITAAIPPGASLETLIRRGPFEVAEYLDEAMVVLLGPRRTRTPIPWQVWEELGAWLAARGWTELGAGRGQPTSFESLNGFLDARISRSTGSYVAAIL